MGNRKLNLEIRGQHLLNINYWLTLKTIDRTILHVGQMSFIMVCNNFWDVPSHEHKKTFWWRSFISGCRGEAIKRFGRIWEKSMPIFPTLCLYMPQLRQDPNYAAKMLSLHWIEDYLTPWYRTVDVQEDCAKYWALQSEWMYTVWLMYTSFYI